LLVIIVLILKMPPKSKKSKGRRRGGVARPSLSLCETFERDLATRSQSCTVKGSLLVGISVSSPGLFSLNLTPSALVVQIAQIGAAYSKYRFNRILFKILPFSPVNTGNTPVGVLDDIVQSGGLPSSRQGVQDLRCSTLVSSNYTVPTEFEWKPIDRSIYYYIQPESTVDDTRFEVPAVLCAWVASTANGGEMQVYYSIEFNGIL